MTLSRAERKGYVRHETPKHTYMLTPKGTDYARDMSAETDAEPSKSCVSCWSLPVREFTDNDTMKPESDTKGAPTMDIRTRGTKKLLLLFIAAILALTGCVGLSINSNDTTYISSNSGQKFSGNYNVMTADGTIPDRYFVKGSPVFAVFQKQSKGGTLKVEIGRGTNIISVSETTVAYGVISVTSHRLC
jgi:hypothetical protein